MLHTRSVILNESESEAFRRLMYVLMEARLACDPDTYYYSEDKDRVVRTETEWAEIKKTAAPTISMLRRMLDDYQPGTVTIDWTEK